MIRLSVLYPSGDGVTFDHDYYREHHVPLCTSTWDVTAEIDKGVDGPYIAGVHFFFESMEQVQAAMGREGTAALQADVPNYTNATPVLQISEIV